MKYSFDLFILCKASVRGIKIKNDQKKTFSSKLTKDFIS